ncbi:hypothetical protein DPEC_G00220170 [Dallia pectoralis]|uniref:Uncharacterized protein n=1 Tax=Dallia pectoralis TaxID=75939 RepID=A0ACC2G3J6_DALPE|nr:hypothetical protein DPEC_G00220170 [Dallia pectoralis]
MFSCFMHDCLTHLSNLSASLQRPSLTVAEVQTRLIATQAVLNTRTASTADCERGFNLMKQVKSDWRSGLRPYTLSDLLTVQLSSPDIEHFDPDSAIQLWYQAASERGGQISWKEEPRRERPKLKMRRRLRRKMMVSQAFLHVTLCFQP